MNRETDETYASKPFDRRTFLQGTAASALLLGMHGVGATSPDYVVKEKKTPVLKGNVFDLTIDYQLVNITGKETLATTINGSLPAPTLIWKEGDVVTLRVKNNLHEDTSIHWHGLILPTNMDGVPGLSFDGIKPGETFTYRFKVQQSGTYWYHSHSGFQEQTGIYGAIIIEPKDGRLDDYDDEHVVMLSDWSDEDPAKIYRLLKKSPHYFATNERTLNDLYQEIKTKGVKATWQARQMWNQMRMSDRDISDVTGRLYTYLINGKAPDHAWLGLFQKGQKIRLRFINAAAMTIFDVRLPGLRMTVVASDGQAIEPVTVDEFRIGVAETYDVIVEPESGQAYTLFAQAIDRSGYALGTLTNDAKLKAFVPDMDPVPILGHADMGMNHSNHAAATAQTMHDHHSHHGHKKSSQFGSGETGYGSAADIVHVDTEFGPHVDMRAESPRYMLDDPGIGLRDHQSLYGRKVLTYADIKNRYETHDKRAPEREIQLHLTGNMSRYMWSINGIPFSDAEPLMLSYGERVRVTLVNDTMMNHPMHLHGMWSELETGDANYLPRKHTMIVQPGAKISYLLTADAKGRWAYHCHLLYHMAGMFREVRVR